MPVREMLLKRPEGVGRWVEVVVDAGGEEMLMVGV